MYVSGEMEFEELLVEMKRSQRRSSRSRLPEATDNDDDDEEEEEEDDDDDDIDDDEESCDDSDLDVDYEPPTARSAAAAIDAFDLSQFTKSGLKRRPRRSAKRRSLSMDTAGEDDDESAEPRRRRRALASALPTSLLKFMGLAEMKLAKMEYDGAVEICERIIKECPRAWEPYATLSDVWVRRGEKRKARQYMFLAARLNPSAADKWCTLIDWAKEADEPKDAADYCRMALRLYRWERDVELSFRRELVTLYEQMGEQRKALTVQLRILERQLCDSAEDSFGIARMIANEFFGLNELEKAVEAYLSALRQFPAEASDVDKNNTLFLMLHLKQYDQAILFSLRYCGLSLLDNDGSAVTTDLVINRLVTPDSLASWELPAEVAPDIVFKLIIAFVHCGQMALARKIVATRLQSVSVDVFDDFFFEVAEAMMQRQHYLDARNLLDRMIQSENFAEKARVWLAMGECLAETGEDERAIEAFQRVVSLVPEHLDARVKLSSLQMKLGRGAEALHVLSANALIGEFPSDAGQCTSELFRMSNEQRKLLLHRCMTLDATGDVRAFVRDSWALLFTDFDVLMSDSVSCKMTMTYRSTRYRSQAIREMVLRYLARDPDALSRALSWLFPSTQNAFSVDCLWDIFIKLVEGLWQLQEWGRLRQACLLGNMFPLFVQDELKLEQCEFLHLTCCLLSADGRGAYATAKYLCRQFSERNQVWNVLNLVAIFNKDLQHNRFVLRELKRDMDNFAANMMNAHNCMIAGSYKYAVASYASILDRKEDDPLVHLMMGVAFMSLVVQKHTNNRHALVIQGFAFLNRYLELRGECQESLYNLGRAFHHIGLYHVSIHYYEQALALPPVGKDDEERSLLDLTQTIAFNLMQIYRQEGNERLAHFVMQKYLII